MEEYDYNHPENPGFAERAMRKATTVVMDDDDVLYIYADLEGKSYPQKTLYKIIDNIKDTFQKQLPNAKIVVGFHDLQFTTISRKQAFAEKVAGTVK